MYAHSQLLIDVFSYEFDVAPVVFYSVNFVFWIAAVRHRFAKGMLRLLSKQSFVVSQDRQISSIDAVPKEVHITINSNPIIATPNKGSNSNNVSIAPKRIFDPSVRGAKIVESRNKDFFQTLSPQTTHAQKYPKNDIREGTHNISRNHVETRNRTFFEVETRNRTFFENLNTQTCPDERKSKRKSRNCVEHKNKNKYKTQNVVAI